MSCFRLNEFHILGLRAQSHFVEQHMNMSILRFISLGNKTLPSTDESKEAATEVEKEIQKSQSTLKHGIYGAYSPQQRYEIGKYAAENSPTTAARKFQHYFRRSPMKVQSVVSKEII